MSDLAALEQRALRELQACADEAALASWRTRYFGDKGEVPAALKKIGTIPQEERKTYGQQANKVKETLLQAYEAADARLKEEALQRSLTEEKLDVTLPGRPVARGRLHVSRPLLREITGIFADLGF